MYRLIMERERESIVGLGLGLRFGLEFRIHIAKRTGL